MKRLPWAQRQAYYSALSYHPVSQSALRAHQSAAHRVLAAGGEDGGKSYFTAYELGPNVLAPQEMTADGRLLRTRLFVIAGPTYGEPRKEFEYLRNQMEDIGALDYSEMPKEGQWRMQVRAGNYANSVETRSLENPEAIRAYKPDGIAIVEAGKVERQAVHRLIGRGSAYDAFMVISGSFESSHQWYHDWYRLGQVPGNGMRLESFSLPTWENAANYPLGRQDPKILEMERIYPPDYFLERCAAIPVPPAGLVLKGLDPQVHIQADLVADIERGPVYLWVDPGYGGAYAVEAFQVQGGRAYGVDELYEAGRTTEEMVSLCKQREWWPWVSSRGTIDFAARQHQASESVIEQWRHFARVSLYPPVERPVRVYEAVERLNTSLHQGQLVCSPKMTGFLKEANIGDGPIPGMRPWRFRTGADGTVIDRDSTEGFNHASMAIAYGLIDHFGFAPRSGPKGGVQYMAQEPEVTKAEPYVRWGPKKIEVPG